MRSVRFVCLFAILISMLVLAQSSRVGLINQPNRLLSAQQLQLGLPLNFSRIQHGAVLSQHGASAFEETPTRRRSPTSGLSFAPPVPYGSGGYFATSVEVADVNGDGKPDLVVANDCAESGCVTDGNVGVLLGRGDGTFQTTVTYDSGGRLAVGIAVADVNGDGKPDLLVANACVSNTNCSGAVGVLLGNGDGTFQTATTYGSGGYLVTALAIADVNGDGKPDLVVANLCTAFNKVCTNANGVVGVLLGKGDGTFQTAEPYGTGGLSAGPVGIKDINADGKPDLLVTNQCADSNCSNGSVGVLLGNGDGTFQAAVTYGSGGYSTYSLVVMDVNGDGKPDLVTTSECPNSSCNAKSDGTVGVLLGNGDGTFQPAAVYDAGVLQPYSVTVADVNGDGIPDVVLTSGNSTLVSVLLGNGEGTFQTAVTYSAGDSTASVAIADVNGDGKPDLLVANPCFSTTDCNNGAASVLINTSRTPTTTMLTSTPNPSNFGQAVIFTATVKPRVWKGTPTGTVNFFDGTTNIGSSQLNNSGVATLTTSTLPAGTDGITAIYKGDSNFLSSTSRMLQQVVQGAIASFSPTSLNFGNQTVGITSSPQNVALKNKGNINLTITSIQITGTNNGDFAQTNNCPSSLPPNNSCQISVTFTPTAAGTRNAAVSVTDNAPGSPQSVPVTGVGILPAVTFSPTSLTFPTQLIFTTSKPQAVKLTNTGAGILLITQISATGQFSQTNNCPSSLSPNASCTINIKFQPMTKGVLHGSVNITDNAPGSPQKVPLRGTSTYVQLRPPKLNFGVQPVGTKSLPKRVALTNQGHETLNITSITITGADAGDFTETNNCGKQLPSGASCFIKVTFKPLVKGKRVADVSINDDGGASPQKVDLRGTGT